LISIVDAHTTTTTVDHTGQVSEGFMIVKGVLSEATYHQTDVNEYYVWRGQGSLQMGDHNVRIRTSPDSLDALAKDETLVSCLIMGCVSTRSCCDWYDRSSEKGMFRVEGLFFTRVDNPICEYERISLFEFDMPVEDLFEKLGICDAVKGDPENPKATQASWSDATVTENIKIV